jgi:hypothetical protein
MESGPEWKLTVDCELERRPEEEPNTQQQRKLGRRTSEGTQYTAPTSEQQRKKPRIAVEPVTMLKWGDPTASGEPAATEARAT